MAKELKYSLDGEYMPNAVVPAKSDIPQWYKNIGVTNYNNLTFDEKNLKRTTPKNCVPFLEAITGGYLATLWCDVYVNIERGIPRLTWYGAPDPIVTRPYTDNVVAIPSGHVDVNVGIQSPFIFDGPKGYSALITAPLNRHELPFTVLSGIVDLDQVLGTGIIPFYIKEGFEGLVPIGTPLFQIIPFKREAWQLTRDDSLVEANRKQSIEKRRWLLNWYRENVWTRKEFN